MYLVAATLTTALSRCPFCHSLNKNDEHPVLVKNGKKISRILMNKAANQKTILELKKQRYHCRQCQQYFILKTTIVALNCFIARNVHLQIVQELMEKQAMTLIAKRTEVSWSTVSRALTSLESYAKVRKDWLPECLLFDEFRSLKSQVGKFSFSLMDGKSGKLLDILPDRRKKALIQYFMSFTKEARRSVKFIVTDMNAPYFSVVRECFPNAQPIVDRFHIVQHLNRYFDQVRKRVMKKLDQRNSAEAQQYRQLKALFKLLLKDEKKLDYSKFQKQRNFGWRHLREVDVVERLLSISSELRLAYQYYQELLAAFHQKDGKQFFFLLENMPKEVPSDLHYLKKPL